MRGWLAFAATWVVTAGCASAKFTAETAAADNALVMLANIDDDDQDAIRDGLDARLNGDRDLEDLVRLTLSVRCLGDSHVTLAVVPSSVAQHVRVFQKGQTWSPLVAGETRMPCGETQLAVEALRTRSQLWDGRASLQVAVDGHLLATLSLRVAAVIFPDVTKPARQVYAVEVAEEGAKPNSELLDLLGTLQTPVTLVNGEPYHFERWIIDALTTGVQRRPDGAVQDVLVAMDRKTGALGLERLPAALLAPDRGLALPGRDEPNLLSYGGNLQVLPPHPGYPEGRLLIGGGGTRHMGPSTRAWLEAQEVQAPALEVSTEWLESGHVDEVVAFVPSSSTRGWALVIASPRLALTRLETLKAHGQGAALLRTARGDRAVDAILSERSLRVFNEEAEERLQSVRRALVEATGLHNDEVIELPQLFDKSPNGLAVALHPSQVNLVAIEGRALLLSSDVDSTVFEPVVRERLRAHGVTPTFVNETDAYHSLGGGLHCALEVQRRASATRPSQ